MVLAKTDKGIVYIRGRFGGVYFKRGSPGIHIQAMPRIVHHGPLGLQMSPIGKFTGMSVIWHLALLAAFGAAWAAFALLYYFTDKRGEKKHITGFNWYIHYTMTFPGTDEPHLWGPPHSPYDLPDYICSAGKSWHYRSAPTDWPADYPAGYYWPREIWNGKLFYAVDAKDWYLWWKDPEWCISKVLGMEDPDSTYYGELGEIVGWYRNPITNKLVHIYVGKRE